MSHFLRRMFDHVALNDHSYRFLFARNDTDEAISLDCETTGFDPGIDDVISIAAIPITGTRIRTSEAFRAVIKPDAALEGGSIKVHQLRRKDVEHGQPMRDVMPELLRFIGNRPLIGYWIAFDASMLDKHVFRLLNIRLPNRLIDVCDLYYDRKYGNAPPGTAVDLRFAAILDDLALPHLHAHDAFNDAVMAAQAFVILKDMKQRGVRVRRPPSSHPLPMALG
jgi:DNA polymerase III subunit epsilon